MKKVNQRGLNYDNTSKKTRAWRKHYLYYERINGTVEFWESFSDGVWDSFEGLMEEQWLINAISNVPYILNTMHPTWFEIYDCIMDDEDTPEFNYSIEVLETECYRYQQTIRKIFTQLDVPIEDLTMMELFDLFCNFKHGYWNILQ